MKRRHLLPLAFAACSMLAANAAWAGHRCEAFHPSVVQLQQGLALAQHTQAALQASGAQVVLLARAGQDLSAYGLHWSHMAFAVRDETTGTWRVVHKLNACGTPRAALYRQGLGEFFMDNPWRYEAAFVVPTPEVQEALRPLLADNAQLAALNTPRYSMVAYPWSQRYQQSNQWLLETLALAVDPDHVHGRDEAQAWLRLHHYEPTTIHLSALQRLGADLTAANVAFDDHPPSRRFSGRIDTVTVDSVFDFLAREHLAGAPQTLR
jgi:hypothetical protein